MNFYESLQCLTKQWPGRLTQHFFNCMFALPSRFGLEKKQQGCLAAIFVTLKLTLQAWVSGTSAAAAVVLAKVSWRHTCFPLSCLSSLYEFGCCHLGLVGQNAALRLSLLGHICCRVGVVCGALAWGNPAPFSHLPIVEWRGELIYELNKYSEKTLKDMLKALTHFLKVFHVFKTEWKGIWIM